MRMWNVVHLCHQDYGLWFHINSSIYLLINDKTSILLPRFKMWILLTFLNSYILLCTQTYVVPQKSKNDLHFGTEGVAFKTSILAFIFGFTSNVVHWNVIYLLPVSRNHICELKGAQLVRFVVLGICPLVFKSTLKLIIILYFHIYLRY